VLTNLTRTGSPLIRYRTGDLVRWSAGADGFMRLEGGILGRADDMIHVRGNNLYPAALEAVIRRFPEVAEYRVEIDHRDSLTALRVQVEAAAPHSGDELAAALERALRDEFLFRAEVRPVPAGSLPRFEMKAKRVVHHRGAENTEKKPREEE
jgi:phenylacetate-CoA ligase